jgi:hypothetical protein
MKTIEYNIQGEPISDFDCDLLAREFLLREGDHKIIVSTALFITAVRVHINEGLVPCEEVEFLYQGLLLRPNKDGRLQEWPNGFCDVEERLLFRLLPIRKNKHGHQS